MKVCVLGASGFIGCYVVRALHAAGHTVRCGLRSERSDTSRIAGIPFERVSADIGDADSLKAAFAGCDCVIHLALSAAWDQMRTKAQQQALVDFSRDGTRNVLAAAQRAGNLRVVFASSIASINCSKTPERTFDEASAPEALAGSLAYVAAKRAAESVCAEFVAAGLPVVIVNPTEVYGAEDTLLVTAGNLKTMINDWPAIITRTGGTSICAVTDVADAIVAALTRGRSGERYILGGPNVSVRQLCAATLRLAGQPNKWTLALPHSLIRLVVKLCCALGVSPPVEPGVLEFAVLYWYCTSCAKAQAELGYQVREVDEILAPAIGWLRSVGHIKDIQVTKM